MGAHFKHSAIEFNLVRNDQCSASILPSTVLSWQDTWDL